MNAVPAHDAARPTNADEMAQCRRVLTVLTTYRRARAWTLREGGLTRTWVDPPEPESTVEICFSNESAHWAGPSVIAGKFPEVFQKRSAQDSNSSFAWPDNRHAAGHFPSSQSGSVRRRASNAEELGRDLD